MNDEEKFKVMSRSLTETLIHNSIEFAKVVEGAGIPPEASLAAVLSASVNAISWVLTTIVVSDREISPESREFGEISEKAHQIISDATVAFLSSYFKNVKLFRGNG
jgi:uncharacterized membrane protein (DUF485 family)